MGLADTLCGDYPLADEPPPARAARRNVSPPAAVLFDASTKDFPLDTVGQYIPLDPVDQRVALALLTIRGTLAGNPEVGAALRSIRYLDPRKIKALVSDAVRTALAAELRARTINLIGIDVELPNRSSLLVRVTYRNLMLLKSTPITFPLTVTLNG